MTSEKTKWLEYPMIAKELSWIYLEDSYVLNFVISPDQVAFDIEFVMTPKFPEYQAPRSGEHHFYKKGRLIFPNPKIVDYRTLNPITKITDPEGQADFGNIDCFFQAKTDFSHPLMAEPKTSDMMMLKNGDYFLSGSDWGYLRIHSQAPQIMFEAGAKRRGS